MKKIRWDKDEISIIRKSMFEIISNRKMPRSDWASLLAVAQKALPTWRRREPLSLAPKVWTDPSGKKATSTTQLVIVGILSELGIKVPRDETLPEYSHILSNNPNFNQIPLVAEVVPESPKLEVALPVNNRLEEKITEKMSELRKSLLEGILGHEKAMVECIAKEQLNHSVEGIHLAMNQTNDRMKRVEAQVDTYCKDVTTIIRNLSLTVSRLEDTVTGISEFITGHGYRPVKGPWLQACESVSKQ
jgi:hypothetical protein